MGNLKVRDLVEGNRALQEIKLLDPTIHYAALPEKVISKPCYLAFSDASLRNSAYGQTGYLSGCFFPATDQSVYHILDWSSNKQQRVVFSSIGAEILAAATSADRGSLYAERISVLYNTSAGLPFVLAVESLGFYATITTLKEGADYRLRPTVCRIRDAFEEGEISVMQWIQGLNNLADALTKRNKESFNLLNRIMKKGYLDNEIFELAKRVTSLD